MRTLLGLVNAVAFGLRAGVLAWHEESARQRKYARVVRRVWGKR